MERRRKAIGVLTGFRACWLMAVCIWLENQGVKGQPVSLIAVGTGQTTTAFTVTFGDGQPTADVTSYLPVCIVSSGSGSFIRLAKTDGSLVLGETGAFTVFGRAPVNNTVHPILDTLYTGLYHCRTVDHNSTQTYQLNIVAQQVQSGPSPTPLTLTYTGDTHNIPCVSSGNFPLNSSWNSTLTLDTQMIQAVTHTNMVDSMFSFQQNDSQIVFTESDTSGVTFNVTCTTSYTSNFDCFANDSTPARPQSVIDRCVNASKPIPTTASVTIRALCPDLNNSNFNYKPIARFDTQPGTPVSIECRTGFLSNNSMEITQSTCQGNGRWQPSPPMCESCMLLCNDTNVVDCNHLPAVGVAMATVNCTCRQNFQWTMGECQPTHCPELSSTTVTTLPRSTIGTSITASCMSGYGNISMPSTVICQADGTWTTLPTCQESPSATPEGGGGIGAGAIVGIAVGGAVLAIVLVVIIILVIKKQPRCGKALRSSQIAPEPAEAGVPLRPDVHQYQQQRLGLGRDRSLSQHDDKNGDSGEKSVSIPLFVPTSVEDRLVPGSEKCTGVVHI
ncbi:uncharacterized protein LOC135811926 isoform X2 [Sycon ciliatum]|uniref:uncharacterized protein LOC135811926 isoform X2 n=1 Tax=Sycon ciliatum TaxID=27933 RepID=UPI0031F6368F